MTDDEFGWLSFYQSNPIAVAVIVGIIAICAAFGTFYLRGSQIAKFRLEMVLRTALNLVFTGVTLYCVYMLFELRVLREDFDELSPVMGETVVPGIIRNLSRSAILHGVISLGIAIGGWWLQFRRAKKFRRAELSTDASTASPST
ncbi:MAG: hypothetical protein HUU46_19955 [Candidatus Hydrogenedentes bacterium]|nr:hypothetical protein [Candidatus Hydrogenedentota bacterium]